MKDIDKVVTLFFVGAIVLAILTHPVGFTSATTSSFNGINKLGQTLSGNGLSTTGGGTGRPNASMLGG